MYEPLGNRIVILRDPVRTTSAGGIALPDRKRDEYLTIGATVIAVGRGHPFPLDVRAGDRVVVLEFVGSPFPAADLNVKAVIEGNGGYGNGYKDSDCRVMNYDEALAVERVPYSADPQDEPHGSPDWENLAPWNPQAGRPAEVTKAGNRADLVQAPIDEGWPFDRGSEGWQVTEGWDLNRKPAADEYGPGPSGPPEGPQDARGGVGKPKPSRRYTPAESGPLGPQEGQEPDTARYGTTTHGASLAPSHGQSEAWDQGEDEESASSKPYSDYRAKVTAKYLNLPVHDGPVMADLRDPAIPPPRDLRPGSKDDGGKRAQALAKAWVGQNRSGE